MTTNALLSRYDALLSDLDGVVYAGPFAIEGAPEALNRAEEELNVPVIFVTNNACPPPQYRGTRRGHRRVCALRG